LNNFATVYSYISAKYRTDCMHSFALISIVEENTSSGTVSAEKQNHRTRMEGNTVVCYGTLTENTDVYKHP
jgi:hypothetical protein